METRIVSKSQSLSSIPLSESIVLSTQGNITDNVIPIKHNIPQTLVKPNNSKHQSRILKFKVNISRLALQSELSMTPVSSPLPMSSPLLASSPISNTIDNENTIKKPGKKTRISSNIGPKVVRKRKAEEATVIVINVGDTSQKHQNYHNLAASGQKTISAPLLPSKLGPKANTGAINAGLRALDRTGKPCRKWSKKKITIDCISGIKWEINGWKDDSAL
ncbi:uncharacterized protein T551_00794 [Pneumocystis jirovecii RU7]|uniref:Uncharacterized protein n=1 Tax=Pneumocystis jirovecii (strain RU7) TaxID=1408657 RepID=A0A0W4ZUV1_PNEJ7|nr:uncharacterized protein T551_00794 [Pneumocystis jirovecii RU7]KTW32112.1 hypothetical protein T551_00794 [Pneumocystis jirovecii RU7]